MSSLTGHEDLSGLSAEPHELRKVKLIEHVKIGLVAVPGGEDTALSEIFELIGGSKLGKCNWRNSAPGFGRQTSW